MITTNLIQPDREMIFYQVDFKNDVRHKIDLRKEPPGTAMRLGFYRFPDPDGMVVPSLQLTGLLFPDVDMRVLKPLLGGMDSLVWLALVRDTHNALKVQHLKIAPYYGHQLISTYSRRRKKT